MSDEIKVKYSDSFGNKKIIHLDPDKKDYSCSGACWYIDEEPFVLYEHEIKNGKFDSPLHNEAIKANKEIPKILKRMLWKIKIYSFINRIFK